MKQYKKRFAVGILLAVSLFALSACGDKSKTSDNDVSVSASPAPSDNIEESEAPETSNVPESPDPDGKETTNPGEIKINIYGMNDETLESEPAHAVIKGEVNAQSIVAAVVEEFEAHSVAIGIDEVTQEKDRVIVSFEKDKAPLAVVGSDVESTILNCISDSLMDNLDSCKAVVYRAEGEAYESGHYAFDLDEVYTSE